MRREVLSAIALIILLYCGTAGAKETYTSDTYTRVLFLWGTQLMLIGAALACLLFLVFVLANIVESEMT